MAKAPSQSLREWGSLVYRALIALIFIASGFLKLADPEGTATSASIPLVIAVISGLFEAGAGLALLAGFRTRGSAVALMVFLIPVTLRFHNPVGLGPAESYLQTTMLMKNMAIVGGLVGLFVYGPGPLSLDALRARK
ncbi:MAG: DoxX family protein [Polyangiaceae bacterium]